MPTQFTAIRTDHETSQNSLLPAQATLEATKAAIEAAEPEGSWISESLYSGPTYFFTITNNHQLRVEEA